MSEDHEERCTFLRVVARGKLTSEEWETCRKYTDALCFATVNEGVQEFVFYPDPDEPYPDEKLLGYLMGQCPGVHTVRREVTTEWYKREEK